MIQIENQGTQIIQTYKKYTANFHAKKKKKQQQKPFQIVIA